MREGEKRLRAYNKNEPIQLVQESADRSGGVISKGQNEIKSITLMKANETQQQCTRDMGLT